MTPKFLKISLNRTNSTQTARSPRRTWRSATKSGRCSFFSKSRTFCKAAFQRDSSSAATKRWSRRGTFEGSQNRGQRFLSTMD